jgi:transcriptional regulator with XRE-family HTH domain
MVSDPNRRFNRRTITAHEEIRRRCGYGVVALARAAGFSHTYVSLVEAGTLRPSTRYRKAVATVLGVPEALIFTPEKREPAVTGSKGSREKQHAKAN